ncbi:Arf guanine nucleotide exchange factor sbh1 [Nothophoma quercina]|uniref:Arf guanine nucleotide exchange factor sbh1 n=1 Tax=Nothophoma quercina TaxID=749835 RepID=A0ABR3RFH2_9PLEO
MRRKAAADRAEKVSNQRPSSTRAAGAGGSSSTMLRLYTDESPGLKVDPVVVMTLSVVFIFSVVALHGMLNAHLVTSQTLTKSSVMAKVARRFTA